MSTVFNLLAGEAPAEQEPPQQQIVRLRSRELFQQTKSIEIEHDGKIYQLRLTRLNKLILTA